MNNAQTGNEAENGENLSTNEIEWRNRQQAPRDYYEENAWRYADDVKVDYFRQIFIWPLAMRHPRLHQAEGTVERDDWDSTTNYIEELARQIEASQLSWKRIADPLLHIGRGEGSHREHGINEKDYEEFVYFYEFVQRCLFNRSGRNCHEDLNGGIQNSEKPHVYIFKRDDITSVEADIAFWEYSKDAPEQLKPVRFSFDVDRLNLYLFSTGVATLVAEIAAETEPRVQPLRSTEHGGKMVLEPDGEPISLNLKHVQQFQDHFRRAYTPYWEKKETKPISYRPGRVPLNVTWKSADTAKIESSYGPDKYESELRNLLNPQSGSEQSAPIFLHWRALLPLRLLNPEMPDDQAQALLKQNAELKKQKVEWRHVVDERIPFMTYLEADTKTISRGDWARLCFADEPGGDSLPYAFQFLKNFETENCYDRFWHYGTRHMFSGYAYVVAQNPCREPGDFYGLRSHFRRQYFQMVLLAHFEMAALLTYSNWVSLAIERFSSDTTQHGKHVGLRSRSFADCLFHIQEEFLDFIHRFRFTGVSNQMQALEMYRRMRDHLNLRELYGEVKDELHSATEYLQALKQNAQAEAANTLGEIAAFAVALGLPTGVFGMNILFGNGLKPLVRSLDVPAGASGGAWLLELALILAATGGSLWLFRRVLAKLLQRESRLKTLMRLMQNTTFIASLLALIGFALVHYWQPFKSWIFNLLC